MILVLVGALNWGLVGAFDINIVNAVFGSWARVERVIYVLVGLAAISLCFVGSCGPCKKCMSK